MYAFKYYSLYKIVQQLCKFMLQNDGEIDYFEVHVLNNDDKSVINIWSLVKPVSQASQDPWKQGFVQIVNAEGEKEYQVCTLYKSVKQYKLYLLFEVTNCIHT